MIPEQLKTLRQWINWRYENRDGKPTKVPYQPSGVHAKSNDPATWSNYEDVAGRGGFVGFVFAADGEFFGIDLDECLIAGELAPWAGEIVERFPAAYVEVSPSGRGLKLFCRGSIKKGRSKKIGSKLDGADKAPGVEVYGQGRYFTVTGDVFQAGDLEADSLAGLAWLKAQYWPATPAPSPALIRPAIECDVDRRAAKYLEHCEPAISGQGGSNQTYSVCARLIHGFLLSPERAFTLLAEWNARCNPPWSEFDLRRKCEQAAKGNCNRSPGWLLAESREASPDSEAVDLSEFEVPLQLADPAPRKQRTPTDPGNLPDELIARLPGLIGEVVRYNLASARHPQPELAVGGAVCLMSVLTGRKIKDVEGTRTNLYTLAIGPTASGKEHARRVNKTVLAAGKADHLNGNEGWASGAGLIRALADQPATLFQVDEISGLLARAGKGNGAPHLKEIGDNLLRLYSSSSTTFKGSAYRDADNDQTIVEPHAVLYGTATPLLWDEVDRSQVHDGLLGRFLVFDSRGRVDERLDVREMPAPTHIATWVERWAKWMPGGGDLNPVAQVCDYVPAALERIRDHKRQINQRAREEDATHPERAAVWARSGEKTAKLALLFAASRAIDPATDAITVCVEDVNLAIALCNWCTRKLVHAVIDRVSGSRNEAARKAILRAIGDRGPENPLTTTDLYRVCGSIETRERREILADLTEAGEIAARRIEGKGRPTTGYYRVIHENDPLNTLYPP